MARMTFDAIAIQSVIGVGERISIVDAAQRAFGPDEITVSAVSIMRAKRAVTVLKERGLIEIDGSTAVPTMKLKSATEANGEAAMQLYAVITRTIITHGPSVAEPDPE